MGALAILLSASSTLITVSLPAECSFLRDSKTFEAMLARDVRLKLV